MDERNSSQHSSFGLLEIFSSGSQLLSSGLKLIETGAKAELQTITHRAAWGIAAILLWHLGVLGISAGLILELGKLWGDRYGFSALAVGGGLVFLGTLASVINKKA